MSRYRKLGMTSSGSSDQSSHRSIQRYRQRGRWPADVESKTHRNRRLCVFRSHQSMYATPPPPRSTYPEFGMIMLLSVGQGLGHGEVYDSIALASVFSL